MIGSSLTPRGSTRRWRRLRAYVLNRDGHACRFILEGGAVCGAYANHVHHIYGRSDERPEHLAAACAFHNLAKGDEHGLHVRTGPENRHRHEWSW